MKTSYDASYEPIFGGRRMVFALAVVLLGSDLLGGAFRYYFSMFHVEPLLYAPKFLALLISAIWPFRFGMNPGIRTDPFPILLAYAILLFSLWVAAFNLHSPASSGYMLLILAPFVLGMHLPDTELSGMTPVLMVVGVMWLVTVAGVVIDCFVDYPWKAAELEIYGKTIEVSRSWMTTGVELDRLAGFTRLSVAAALYGGIFGIVFIRLSRAPMTRGVVFAMTLGTLMLTTTKSAVVAYLFVILLQLMRPAPVLRAALYVLALFLSIYLPLSSPPYSEMSVYTGDQVSRFLMDSFHDRLLSTWPNFIGALRHGVFGEGLGGIGSPNQMYGNSLSNPSLDVADNFTLYLIGLFGFMPGLAIFTTLGYGAYRMAFSGTAWRQAVGLAGVFVLVAGVVVDVVESVAGGLVLGMVVRGMAAMPGHESGYATGRMERVSSGYGLIPIFRRIKAR